MSVFCEVSIHSQKNKPATKEEMAKLGRGWKAHKFLTVQEFKDLVTKKGFAYSSIFRNGVKRRAEFVRGNVFSLDFDGGMTIGECLSDNFVRQNASFIYTTPSHTKDNERFRLVFVAEKSIVNADDYENVIQALLNRFPRADAACKDACRLFYGNNRAIVKSLNNILSVQVINKMVGELPEKLKHNVKQIVIPEGKTDELAAEIAEILNHCQDWYGKNYDGDYSDWVRICHSVFSVLPNETGIELIVERWGEESRENAQGILQAHLTKVPDDRVTIRTLMHYAKINPYNKGWSKFVFTADEFPLISEMLNPAPKKKPLEPAGELMEEFKAVVLDRSGLDLSRVSTTIPDLDEKLGGGLSPFGITILSGTTGSGKSSLALKIGFQRACVEKKPVIFYSLELGKTRAFSRLLCNLLKLPWDRLIDGTLIPGRDYQFPTNKIAKTDPLYMRERLDGIEELTRDIETLTEVHKTPPLVIVDYVQYMTPNDNTGIRQYMEQQTTAMVELSKTHCCSFLALSSVSNENQKRLAPSSEIDPSLATLVAKETGKFGYDSDTCIALSMGRISSTANAGFVLVGKNRSGSNFSNSKLPVKYLGEFGEWTSAKLEEMPQSKVEKYNQRKAEQKITQNQKLMKDTLEYISKGGVSNKTQLKDVLGIGKNRLEEITGNLRKNGMINKENIRSDWKLTKKGKEHLESINAYGFGNDEGGFKW